MMMMMMIGDDKSWSLMNTVSTGLKDESKKRTS